MPKTLILMLALVGILSGGFIMLEETGAKTPNDDVVERWINANHLQVQLNGQWHEVPMMPLSDSLCSTRHQLFRRYCN